MPAAQSNIGLLVESLGKYAFGNGVKYNFNIVPWPHQNDVIRVRGKFSPTGIASADFELLVVKISKEEGQEMDPGWEESEYAEYEVRMAQVRKGMRDKSYFHNEGQWTE